MDMSGTLDLISHIIYIYIYIISENLILGIEFKYGMDIKKHLNLYRDY